jgi:hypothetical protein
MRLQEPSLTMRPRRDLKCFSIGAEYGCYPVTIQESEETQKQNPDDPGKVLDIAYLKRDKHACGKHDCGHRKTVSIGELSGAFESSDYNNGCYHNWILTLGLSNLNGKDTHESSLRWVYKFDPEPCPTYAPSVA